MGESRRHAGARPRSTGSLTALVRVSAAVAAALIPTAFAIITLHFARTVVIPPKPRPEDVTVLAVDDDEHSITLGATADSVLEGDYSFWFDAARGHARLGAVLDRTPDSVTRRVLRVDSGNLSRARRGRLGGWFYVAPDELGLPFSDVPLPTPTGPAPAWLFPAPVDRGKWVIQVHGRAVNRTETLRAVPVFRDAGYSSLLISYRNDGVAPPSIDGRYGLGDTEWEDVQTALRFAVDHGARHIVLMGWSMGGATVLQAATRSELAGVIRGIVLDSPVVDWVTALDFQAKAMGLPRMVARGVDSVIGGRWARLLTGQRHPIDLARLDFVRRAAELERPILLLHSDDDGFIPVGASRALAAARPDLVTFVEFQVARHTKLWNYDPERWTTAITRWLAELETASARTARATRPRGVAKA